ncbi:MAG: hypothetical protein ABSA11_10785, partial [Candidatus Bathyarchaeia archaeon]
GISTFIATLLLMVLAVAAGVVIYAYVMGYLGGFTTPQTMGALSLDTATLTIPGTAGPTALTAYIRNIGHTSFTAASVYVQTGSNSYLILQSTSGWDFNGGVLVPEGGVGLLTIAQGPNVLGNPMTFASGVTYTVKIIGKDNTQITFNVKG